MSPNWQCCVGQLVFDQRTWNSLAHPFPGNGIGRSLIIFFFDLNPVETSGNCFLPAEELPLFHFRRHFRIERRHFGVDVVVVERLQLDADGGGKRGSQRRRLHHFRSLDGDAWRRIFFFKSRVFSNQRFPLFKIRLWLLQTYKDHLTPLILLIKTVEFLWNS